jgi:hypothetical protein
MIEDLTIREFASLGEDIPMSTANLMDGLVALDKDGKTVCIRIPYTPGLAGWDAGYGRQAAIAHHG